MSKDDVYQLQSSQQQEEEEEDGVRNLLANGYDERYCRTPTSEDQKIRTNDVDQACPPAPKRKQQKSHGFSQKRKLLQFQFYEANGREEVDSFFRSSYDQLHQLSVTTTVQKRQY